MDRVDALGKRPERLRVFRGRMLERRLDDELQRIVQVAAERLHCPSSLVSLILENLQFFRAHHGLSPELQAVLATDRDLSYCQFVVREDAPFEVNDAEIDPRLPREATTRFGVRAYLGAPVRVDGQVVGSLCVVDGAPRTFSPADREALVALAAEASARLEALAAGQEGREGRQRALSFASTPAFSELRNVLGALSWNIAYARVAAAEVEPLARMLEQPGTPDLSYLQKAAHAATDLSKLLAAVEAAADRVQRQVFALEAASTGADVAVTVEVLVPQAAQLAHHYLKLVGGVRWPSGLPGVHVTAARPVAVSALGAALGAAAQACFKHPPAGLILTPEVLPAVVRLWLAGPSFGPLQVKSAAESLRTLLAGELGLDVLEEQDRIGLELPR